jgi:hypothetical protein
MMDVIVAMHIKPTAPKATLLSPTVAYCKPLPPARRRRPRPCRKILRTPAERAIESKKHGDRHATMRSRKSQQATDVATKAAAEMTMVLQINANTRVLTSTTPAQVILLIKQEALAQVQAASSRNSMSSQAAKPPLVHL